MAQDYGKTLNLPVTDFPMRGNLPKREPAELDKWQQDNVYEKMIQKNQGKPLYILHDGPPYANANIHMGTALNKVLKDIIVKYKNMSGFKSPYVPGWDTHGLPIELKAMKDIGVENIMSPLDLRKHCKEFALSFVEEQKKQFLRLGTLGDYKNPYLTLKPEFEARQIEIFGEMAKKGYIYKGLKPVYWCADCNTALAEAEIEYENDPSYTVYVKYPVTKDNGALSKLDIDDLSKINFVIWTTTTWTLPGSVAVTMGPEFNYAVAKAGDEYYIIAEELLEEVMDVAGITDYEVVATYKGKELDRIEAQHPFFDRKILAIVGDHVTLESGTGVVHTAPGHGVEDFEMKKYYPELEVIVPVDDKGYFNELAQQFEGLNVVNDEASKAIVKVMEENGSLFAVKKITHQYPHCWRCKDPVLLRATEQWFCSVKDFKDETIDAINQVEFIPDWGKGRMTNMVENRSDWCISRQRVWGVPIPAFYCTECGHYHIDEVTTKAVSDLFRKEGSDGWYTHEADEILPKDYKCSHCGNNTFRKETDIMDVWFDSGVTHASVLEERDDLVWPSDLYLEGTDQYRGWFQSSLLTAVAWRGTAPYKAVCTHGWVVDGDGRKMSKSLGNGMEPKEIIGQYGADILRLWVASSDYHSDIRISKDILKQLSEAYRKIRNTARFILGNLDDFDPNKDKVPFDEMTQLDLNAMDKLNKLIETVKAGYESFDYHVAYHAIYSFCVVEMSNFYLDIIKDRLYVEKKASKIRRSAQTVMFEVLSCITRMLAPILAFTTQEIWEMLPHTADEDKAHVLYNDMPENYPVTVDKDFHDKWEQISKLHDIVKKALEVARREKAIGSSLDSKVTIEAKDEALFKFVSDNKEELKTVFIVSELDVSEKLDNAFYGEDEPIGVLVEKAHGEKCERCWTYTNDVGVDKNHPTLCLRCAHVLED